MRTIHADNVNEALYLGLRLLRAFGHKRQSRNGEVLVVDGPVCTIYEHPMERVCLSPLRNANPFFHLFESLWMLSGRNDVAFVAQFAKTMTDFSDDGITFHGAYGHRWRKFFNKDQLPVIINRLRKNPDDRRCVLQMWDANADLDANVRDVPCNTQIYFSVDRNGRLDMTVCNRSNDIIWGAYGANAVHMSVLQEYIAYAVEVPIGRYYQISNNWHAYTKILEESNLWSIIEEEYVDPYGQYDLDFVRETILFSAAEPQQWDSQNEMFLDEPSALGFTEKFFKQTAIPMINAWKEWKSDKPKAQRIQDALACLEYLPYQSDWKRACREWLLRKVEK